MEVKNKYKPKLKNVKKAIDTLKNVSIVSPLTFSLRHSKKFNANIFLKREDLQQVRSYKIRGAYNQIKGLSKDKIKKGIVCASAGNHAQGVAFTCNKLKIKGTIFMPLPTPKQKIDQVKMFGSNFIEIKLVGDTFDDSYFYAKKESKKSKKVFVHPFNDEKTIEGQATIGLEILNQTQSPIDYLFLPVGGGGLAAGVSSVFKLLSPNTKIIGVEPKGAPSMSVSIEKDKIVTIEKIDKFIDGAAVKKVGSLTFDICKENLNQMVTVDEGKVCQTILDLYNKDAIVVEPAGALSLTVLDYFYKEIENKNVVCIISGSNNDITRMAEIKERALLYSKLKHYFIVKFSQRPGSLKEFITEILGKNDDITFFEYAKKLSRENAPAIVGVELRNEDDFKPLVKKMKLKGFFGEYLNNKPDLFEYLI